MYMLECTVVEKTSRKTGETYVCLSIDLGNGYTKLVFLTPAEKALIGIANS